MLQEYSDDLAWAWVLRAVERHGLFGFREEQEEEQSRTVDMEPRLVFVVGMPNCFGSVFVVGYWDRVAIGPSC